MIVVIVVIVVILLILKKIKEYTNITLITYKRKNPKIQNNKDKKQKLTKRYKVENFFAKIKIFNRIHVRRDKKLVTYLGFVYLGCISII